MARKSSIAKSINAIDITNLKEDQIESSSNKEASPLDRLINKEITNCAKQLQVDHEELQDWMNSYIQAPQKSQLHLLRTAHKYCLDPLQEQILLTQYDQTWQIAISVDGWLKLIHQHPYFAGITFAESPEANGALPHWIECTIYRSDQVIPTTVREYLSEVKQEGDLWNKMPRRMLRHRALSQCARVAIGITLSDGLNQDKDHSKSAPLLSAHTLKPKTISGLEHLKNKLSAR
jgi:hypothetical protein